MKKYLIIGSILSLFFISVVEAGSYANKIFHLYPSAIATDFRLEDDGTGVILKEWNTSKLGVKPTLADLDAQVDDATANTSMVERDKNEKFNKDTIKALALTMKDYLNELRAIEALSPLTNQEVKDKIISYLP